MSPEWVFFLAMFSVYLIGVITGFGVATRL